LYLTEPDRSRLETALGTSLAGKIIAVVEESASRGNVSAPEAVSSAKSTPKPKKKGKGK
jgi:hypothetical protein